MTTSVFLIAKATIVLILAFGFDSALRKRHVLACAAMWEAVLVALLLLPLGTLSLATFRLHLPQITFVNATSTRVAEARSIEPLITESPSRVPSSELESATESPKRSTNGAHNGDVSQDRPINRSSRSVTGFVIVMLYLVGAVACLIRLAVALIATARLRSAAPSATTVLLPEDY